MGILDAPPVSLSLVTRPTGMSAFTKLPTPRIYRMGGGQFQVRWDLTALRPAAGVTYYVSPTGSAVADGLTSATPTQVKVAVAKSDVGAIVYAPGEYLRENHALTAVLTKSINHLASGPGVRLTAYNDPTALTWTLTSGNIYQTTRSSTAGVVDVTNKTAWGDFTNYEKKADLASIVAAGQWAIVGTTVYVWAIGNTNLSNTANRSQIRLALTLVGAGLPSTGTGVVQYVRGIDFEGCSDAGLAPKSGALVIAEDCTFKYSPTNGISLDGGYFIGIRCQASSNLLDGFNYHDYSAVGTEYVEVDCKGHHNGHLWNTGTNNATTSHDFVKGIRVNGDYDVSGGAPVADVNSAKSWNLGCSGGDSTVAGAQDVAFRVAADTDAANPAQAWYDECYTHGATYAYLASGTNGVMRLHGCTREGGQTPLSTSTDATVTYYDA